MRKDECLASLLPPKMALQASKWGGNRGWKSLVKNVTLCWRRRKLPGLNQLFRVLMIQLSWGRNLSFPWFAGDQIFYWHRNNKTFCWFICHFFFFPTIQSLLSKAAFPSHETKVPPKGFRHLRFTPGADSDDSTQASLVNINPFTPESYRQMLFPPNGKRKTRGEL